MTQLAEMTTMPPPVGEPVTAAAPEAPAHPPRRRRGKRLAIALVTLLALVAAAAAVQVFVDPLGLGSGDGDSPVLRGPDSAPFKLDYPSTWRPLTNAELATLPGQPIAVIRRKDGRGTMVVSQRPPVTQPLSELPEGLKRTLSRRFDDFQEVGVKVINLGGSQALMYSFARTETGTAQTLVIVPSGRHSYTLNAVVPPRSPDSAREVGAMIATFRPDGDG